MLVSVTCEEKEKQSIDICLENYLSICWIVVMVILRDRFIEYCIANYYFKVVKMYFYRLSV